ncbi:MAG TPA: hypothetical protein VKU41_03510 [Polyangiaceae bacterium]|nr:hypothetical protein [Polyangiaceae bacterium]
MREARWILAVAAVGCTYNPLFPDLRSPMSRARDLGQRCTYARSEADRQAPSSSIVEEVEPAYGHVASGNERAPRLRGARLRLRARPDMSQETLQRSIECHQAAVTLGRERASPDDPYVLPGAWLDIVAESTGDGFVVAVGTDDSDEAQRVLARARRFAAARP